ncbi:NADH-dependent flavin oxidoreductase [Oenococcus oeni]|uniref:NADH-dependent flavin oxidoreductase n=1 Tax=Oenococcus oeni TaxID=1247 RepID=UPI0010B55531|nr:NADH-dependent flavin oxidoreductase [Oenococcus oeni]MDV7687130.1 NADH-dependent flavin oxidoreductase [Oenococcus oeni]SYW12701.1 putative NADH-dependent flavin oxidoreductase YqiG [Oenococcus oeni]
MTNYQFLQTFEFKNGIKIKNRIVIPPMTECSSFEDGNVTKNELDYFALRTGGAGIFITPASNVSSLGKGFEGQLSCASDDMLPSLNQVANTIKVNGTKAILQLHHAGRISDSKILRGQQAVSPSAVASLRPGSEIPRELTNEEILQIISDFGQATRRAIEAGFDGIELHGANTYLIQQFFSPHSNRRSDDWGGSLKKRMKFPLAVVEQVHKIVERYADRPFIIGYRISPEEIETPGIRLADTLALIDVLKKQPIDYLHISTRDVWQTSKNDSDDQIPVVDQIKEHTKNEVPLIAVGNIAKPEEAEKVIEDGFNFVALGREMLREPQWVEKVQNGQEAGINYSLNETDLKQLRITPPLWKFLTKKIHSKLTAD